MVWYGMVWYGMVWYGMVWYGMVWYGMVWYGMVWYGMVWYGMVWYGMVWYGMVWYGMVWYGMVWYGMVWYGMVWCGMVWYGMVWYGMVWYGMVWYGMVWYGMVSREHPTRCALEAAIWPHVRKRCCVAVSICPLAQAPLRMYLFGFREPPHSAKGHVKDSDVGANYIVLLTVLVGRKGVDTMFAAKAFALLQGHFGRE